MSSNIKLQKCPQCSSENITWYMGAAFGKYICKKCNYIGPMIIEEIIEEDKE